ncbi:hypothetical protein HYFRA_00001255 [Hymenoscyphus fraxineus]|uniref:Uncharacterized protein n=1 Tax=Hymenoscyphus fraxineus TaxID=746836 RepID=A0A9N9L8B3_9HELO|nr:hypothetical protein HYFRA_00001255 [Hymenoscyphus fraxineus]
MFTFSYPITRDYPFRWFKWVALVGAILLTALVSILNFANNGYTMDVLYTTELNETVSRRLWTQKMIRTDDKTFPTCNSQNLPVNTQYYTNKLGLAYNIANVWQVLPNGKNLTLPSLKYSNNPIDNCTIPLIQLDFTSFDRSAAQLGWRGWGIGAMGFVTCLVNNGQQTYVNLTTKYDFIPPTIDTGAAFEFLQAPDSQNLTSLWWGESLMSWYWLNLAQRMGKQAKLDEDEDITKGTLVLRPHTNSSDLTSLDFFSPTEWHYVSTPRGKSPVCCLNQANNPHNIGALHAQKVKPDVWIESDSFAKVFYSTIMADLGQVYTPNIVSNGALLTAFSKNITIMNNTVESNSLKAGPARVPYIANAEEDKKLAITPSYIYTQYLCQVPKLKSTGSLLLSLLIADLVFLQAGWLILNWVATWRLKNKEPSAMYCEKCVTAEQDSSTIELVEDKTIKSGGRTMYRALSSRGLPVEEGAP